MLVLVDMGDIKLRADSGWIQKKQLSSLSSSVPLEPDYFNLSITLSIMSRYASLYANPQGLGDARPTAQQIITDENAQGRLIGKTIVITGVSSGIGIETVRSLATTGAKLFLVARNLTKAKNAIGESFNPEQMELVEMDQASLESVRSAAATILAKTDKISILVNNAGVMALQDLQLTEQGHELQFATNHLAHFLFFNLLKPALLAGSSPEFHSRVVNVASAGHRVQGLNESENYHYQKGGYTPWGAYGQSKSANVYMANEIERRYGARGLHATSLHPGMVATELGRNLPEAELGGMLQDELVLKILLNPAQGAATTVWAAISQELEGKGGLYLSDCSVAERDDHDPNPASAKYTSHTYSPEAEARLWKDSLEMVGLSDDERTGCQGSSCFTGMFCRK